MKKYGITEWYVPGGGLAAVKLCKYLGFDGIQLGDMGGEDTNYPLLDARIKDMYMQELSDTSFTIYSYHPMKISREPGMQLGLDTDLGRKALEAFKVSVRICREYQIPTVMVASFAGASIRNKYELQKCAESLGEYKKIAEEQGISLVYECFSNLRWMSYLGEQVEGLKFCYDIGNPIKFGFSEPEEDLNALEPEQIDHVHVKDFTQDMSRFCLLGSGTARVENSLELLARRGFDGWVFLENHYNERPLNQYGHGIEAMTEDLARLKNLW